MKIFWSMHSVVVSVAISNYFDAAQRLKVWVVSQIMQRMMMVQHSNLLIHAVGLVLVGLCLQETDSLKLPPAVKRPLESSSPSSLSNEFKEELVTPNRHASKLHHQAKQNHPTPYDESPTFKGPIVLERSSTTSEFHTRVSQYYQLTNRHIPTKPAKPCSQEATITTSRMLQMIADHLAYRDAPIDVKEVAESMEFFLRTRKRLLGSAREAALRANNNHHDKNPSPTQNDDKNYYKIQLLDACAGHGFTGMLFAACNPNDKIETILIDCKEPPSHKKLKTILAEVCPWIEQRVTFKSMTLEAFQADYKAENEGRETSLANGDNEQDHITALPLVIATHACGTLTDQVLDLAVQVGATGIAVMPCCYRGTASSKHGTPYGIKRAFGVSWAADIRRTFFLENHGYHSDFATIPSEITPMNRIITGEKLDM